MEVLQLQQPEFGLIYSSLKMTNKLQVHTELQENTICLLD